MKKRICMLICLLAIMALMGTAASADTQILGETADHAWIHQLTAPNGQKICFTAYEADVTPVFLDVNFDGVDDIVLDTVMGANNVYSEFFVYDTASGAYVRAVTDGTEDRLCNYQLHPEHGLVESRANAGSAGLLHVWNLYRWEGTRLTLVRSAVSDEWTEEIFEGQTYTTIIHGDTLHMTVRDQAGDVIWEVVLPKDDIDFDWLFEQETAALWQGLR